MLNSLRFIISVQLILCFAMQTSNPKANNSNDANDKYSSFNWHQLTYILAFSYSSRGTSHELTPSKVVYQPDLSTSSESINRSTDLNVLRLFDRAVSAAYSSCSGFTSTSGCMAYHQKIMDSRCVQRRGQLDVPHPKDVTVLGEELSRSLVLQHGTHCPTTLKTAALLMSCLNDH